MSSLPGATYYHFEKAVQAGRCMQQRAAACVTMAVPPQAACPTKHQLASPPDESAGRLDRINEVLAAVDGAPVQHQDAAGDWVGYKVRLRRRHACGFDKQALTASPPSFPTYLALAVALTVLVTLVTWSPLTNPTALKFVTEGFAS